MQPTCTEAVEETPLEKVADKVAGGVDTVDEVVEKIKEPVVKSMAEEVDANRNETDLE